MVTHILKLAPDFIKLDRDLVSGIDVDPVRRVLAACLVMFANDTGATIIAEGVETRDELSVLRDLGIDYAQG
jgi:EAL domain-containing protein (putative c-di-GMP-specific phosphodiesterase class I)